MSNNKKLKMQNNIVKRMIKEVKYYKKETDYNKKRIEEMEKLEKDFYDIKKQKEIYEESLMMINDSEKRLKKRRNELEELLNKIHEDENLDLTLFSESMKLLG